MDSVKVALRIRPLVKSEIDNGCQSCIERVPNEPQIGIGKANQMFTFNYVFDEFEGQSKVYNDAVKHLIENLFKGYNLTILAYGQTGSGKTYTMGTNYSGNDEMGVIPRAIYEIFDSMKNADENSYKITVSFIELYNESLYDLLTNKPREQSVVDMREHNNTVVMPGLTEVEVTNPEETLTQLKEGSAGRMVGATAMNSQSSRSHAIFTVNIRIIPKKNPKETIMSKFHLVDLAGSERSKKTGASGDRFREGVNINKGLLVLGNVISQLCEGNHSFINYRDSKLTRLLQDSLGGNSVTLMIACISPADYNQDESLSTLRYADRAKKIKNKPVINQDPCIAEISRLRKENEELRLKIIEGGVTAIDCPPNHKFLEQTVLENEKRIKELHETLVEALSENSRNYERNIMEEKARNTLTEKLSYLTEACEKADEDPKVLFKEIKSKIFEVKAEHIRTEQELRSFEKQSQLDTHDSKDNEEDNDLTSPTKQEHIASQTLINEQILKLTKSLAIKEDLMSKMREKSDYLSNIQDSSIENIEQLKNQITELQKEKDELMNQLKQSCASKISEQRRKRLQELEVKVTTLTKKIVEQERIIKLRENSDVKLSNLQREIMAMKQMKVKLVQQMKTENEKFRSWKAQKDKELFTLKNQNAKNQNQLKKMEMIHSLQQNVLKRKLEAAAASNKRIMAVLERQRLGRLKKTKATGIDQIKDKVHEELELVESSYQAEKSLESLIQDRAILTKELNNIKEKLKDVTITIKEKHNLNADRKKFEHELALRSTEISDLQQKLTDIQDELKTNNWEMIQSPADAKQALIYVFNLLTEKAKENLNKTYIISEIEAVKHEKTEELENYKKVLDDFMDYHQRTIELKEKESEDKMVDLLKHFVPIQMEQNQDSVVSKTLNEQTLLIEKLRAKNKELEEKLRSSEDVEEKQDKMAPTYEDIFHKFVDEYKVGDDENKQPRKSRLTGNFQKLCCRNDEIKENLLNQTFTKTDFEQEDFDCPNELAPKRMRTDKTADSRTALKQLNGFINPYLA